MLHEICQEIRNWFTPDSGKHFGTFQIEGGTLNAPFLVDGQYFRIVGSILNDGVYQYPASGLHDEMFAGAIWAMSVPPSVLALVAEIESYNADHKPNGFSSESFAGYSYTKVTTPEGRIADWKDVFGGRLNRWRKA